MWRIFDSALKKFCKKKSGNTGFNSDSWQKSFNTFDWACMANLISGRFLLLLYSLDGNVKTNMAIVNVLDKLIVISYNLQ